MGRRMGLLWRPGVAELPLNVTSRRNPCSRASGNDAASTLQVAAPLVFGREPVTLGRKVWAGTRVGARAGSRRKKDNRHEVAGSGRGDRRRRRRRLARSIIWPRKGWSDVVLIERKELTSGSTWHAAGLLPLFNMSYSVGQIHKYSVSLYKTLEEETGQHVGFKQVSNIRLARTRDRWDEFMYYAGVARDDRRRPSTCSRPSR